MRAAQTAVRRRLIPSLHAPALQPPVSRREQHLCAMFFFASVFLLGYLPGIWLGNNRQTSLGQQLADYYGQPDTLNTWSAGFLSPLAASFLQLTAVLLCGLCVFGCGFLVLLFAARGVWLGFCAANVLASGGAGQLVLYRLFTCISDLSSLFLCLMLAAYAMPVCAGLFQSVFCSAALHTRLETAARRLGVRYIMALALSVLFCFVNRWLGLLIVLLLG